jgi:hypothetical protein
MRAIATPVRHRIAWSVRGTALGISTTIATRVDSDIVTARVNRVGLAVTVSHTTAVLHDSERKGLFVGERLC